MDVTLHRSGRVKRQPCGAEHVGLASEVPACWPARGPPEWERREEIPWLVARATAAVREGLAVHTALLDACCTRPWPGNVRELLAEARHAAGEAIASGAERVGVEHLVDDAGLPIVAPEDRRRPRGHRARPASHAARAADEAARHRVTRVLVATCPRRGTTWACRRSGGRPPARGPRPRTTPRSRWASTSRPCASTSAW